MKVPFFIPALGRAEEEQVLETIRSKWLSMGPQVEDFEKRFADYHGVKYAVAVNSCTAALHIANLLLNLKSGDEVIVPSLTFAATANAVHYTGATPVFADIESRTDWTISPADVEKKITSKTRAVIAMHHGGYPCDLNSLAALCKDAGLVLIEDACHGLGGQYDGKPLGSIGAFGCFSFYSNKIITTGEGGMLITNDAAAAKRARELRAHSMTATAVDRMRGSLGYEINEIGYNYRLDDLRASIGLAQMDRLDGIVETRRQILHHFHTRLASVENIQMPPRIGEGRGNPPAYLLPITVEGVDRDKLRIDMLEKGVETTVHYQPVHLFKHYAALSSPLPNTEWVAERLLSLPLHPFLTPDQIDYVCDTLIQLIEEG